MQKASRPVSRSAVLCFSLPSPAHVGAPTLVGGGILKHLDLKVFRCPAARGPQLALQGTRRRTQQGPALGTTVGVDAPGCCLQFCWQSCGRCGCSHTRLPRSPGTQASQLPAPAATCTLASTHSLPLGSSSCTHQQARASTPETAHPPAACSSRTGRSSCRWRARCSAGRCPPQTGAPPAGPPAPGTCAHAVAGSANIR